METEHVPGELFAGHFRLLRSLGRGGFGEVWLAEDSASRGAKVALKILRADARGSLEATKRFEREVQAISALEHPAIIKPLEWDVTGDAPFVAMEYIEGRNLAHELNARARSNEHFTGAELTAIFEPVCDAIGYAHANQIVHRDLKPSNVLVSKVDGKFVPKVIDFGMVKMLERGFTQITDQRALLGTLFYMAPEQIFNDDVGPQADIFALGCILFEILTLRLAWARDEHDEPQRFDQPVRASDQRAAGVVISRILRDQRPMPSAWRVGVPPVLDQIVLCALQADCVARFQTVSELEASLRRIPLSALPLPDDVRSLETSDERASFMIEKFISYSDERTGPRPEDLELTAVTPRDPDPVSESVRTIDPVVIPTDLPAAAEDNENTIPERPRFPERPKPSPPPSRAPEAAKKKPVLPTLAVILLSAAAGSVVTAAVFMHLTAPRAVQVVEPPAGPRARALASAPVQKPEPAEAPPSAESPSAAERAPQPRSRSAVQTPPVVAEAKIEAEPTIASEIDIAVAAQDRAGLDRVREKIRAAASALSPGLEREVTRCVLRSQTMSGIDEQAALIKDCARRAGMK